MTVNTGDGTNPYPWQDPHQQSWVPGHGPGLTTNPAEAAPGQGDKPPGTLLKTAKPVTAKSAHEGIVATLILIVFVYLMVIVAGMSKGAGRFVLALFGLAIVIQGLGHTGSVVKWVASKPLLPKDQ
jgi:hypothetical protein